MCAAEAAASAEIRHTHKNKVRTKVGPDLILLETFKEIDGLTSEGIWNILYLLGS